jgi:AcrR family transcriptional regulator
MVSSNDPTRVRILNACYALLTDGGVEPTMGAVAAKAGISRQAVYLHFASWADLLLAMVDHVNAEAGLPAQLARLDAATSSREALATLVEIAVWQSYRLGPAVIRINRLAESHPDLKTLWSRRTGRRARLAGVVGMLRREGELREDLATREAVALLNVMTMPETIMSLRDAGLTRRLLIGILTSSVTRVLCG